MARQLGTPLMPWQQHVAQVAGELIRDDETGLWVPAYPEIVITVPRQSGKTTLILAWEMDRLVLWEPYDGKPQHVAYTAQTGSDARKKFTDDQHPALRRSKLAPAIRRFYFAAEKTGMVMRNDGRLSVLATSDSAGHGATIDLAVLDEIWADQDDRREQALVPAMATRHDRQKIITSTAGDDASVLLDRKMTAGRDAIANGRREGIAYFEWSADESADPEDPNVWWGCMPALGHTITERTVRQALDEMRKDGDLAQFRRAWLNIPARTSATRPISRQTWEAVLAAVAPQGRLTLAADCMPQQQAASIVAADTEGRVELVDHRPGVGWVLPRLIELVSGYGCELVVDQTGPLAHILEHLDDAGVDVIRYTSDDYARACQAFFERLHDRKLAVRPDPHGALTQAALGAVQRISGDRWRWARTSRDLDMSPLVAATLALHRAGDPRSGPVDVQVMLV